MQIILKSRTQFFQREKTTDKDGNETLIVKNTVTVSPNSLPQAVPDWVQADPLFELMAKDGSLIQVQVEQKAKAAATAETAETAVQGKSK
jgi:hypothetical protein